MRMMIKQIIPILLLLVFFTSSCGGGGGRYHTPSVALNLYGLNKTPFVDSAVIPNDRLKIDKQGQVDSEDDRYIERDKYYYFRSITFRGAKYKLAIPLNYWVSIINSKGEVVIKLKTPRYTCDAIAVELTHLQSKSFLAILIEQQATSHSSTLYILDSDFKPIYKEHLLGAEWIAKKHTPDGDVLFVSTEDSWRVNDEWITIGGNWQYNIFKAIRKTHNK